MEGELCSLREGGGGRGGERVNRVPKQTRADKLIYRGDLHQYHRQEYSQEQYSKNNAEYVVIVSINN